MLLARLGEADARGLSRSRGATSMVAWLRGSHRVGPGEASRLMRTARALRERLPATAQALAEGRAQLGQVEVIADSLEDLSTEVSPVQRAEGEATLISACDSLDPVGLGRLGRRLEELLDPTGSRPGTRPRSATTKPMRSGNGHSPSAQTHTGRPGRSADARPGRVRGDHRRAGGTVRAATRNTRWGEGHPLTRRRRYDAFVEIACRGLHHPVTGSGDGGKAQIRVTIPLASLTGRTGYGVLDDGTQISPTLARMLACDAAIIPAVLNGAGQPIDLGRERRLFTGPARTAIEIRDGGCVWPGGRAAGLTRRRQRASIAARNVRGAPRARSRAM